MASLQKPKLCLSPLLSVKWNAEMRLDDIIFEFDVNVELMPNRIAIIIDNDII